MAKITKRAMAFELFDQGKTPKDSELEALELKKKTLGNYYREWSNQVTVIEEAPAPVVEEAPAPPLEVPAGTLKPGEEFELRGVIYRAGAKDGVYLITSIPTQPQLGARVVRVDEMVKPTRRLSPSGDHA